MTPAARKPLGPGASPAKHVADAPDRPGGPYARLHSVRGRCLTRDERAAQRVRRRDAREVGDEQPGPPFRLPRRGKHLSRRRAEFAIDINHACHSRHSHPIHVHEASTPPPDEVDHQMPSRTGRTGAREPRGDGGSRLRGLVGQDTHVPLRQHVSEPRNAREDGRRHGHVALEPRRAGDQKTQCAQPRMRRPEHRDACGAHRLRDVQRIEHGLVRRPSLQGQAAGMARCRRPRYDGSQRERCRRGRQPDAVRLEKTGAVLHQPCRGAASRTNRAPVCVGLEAPLGINRTEIHERVEQVVAQVCERLAVQAPGKLFTSGARGLDAQRHREARARVNPLPADEQETIGHEAHATASVQERLRAILRGKRSCGSQEGAETSYTIWGKWCVFLPPVSRTGARSS